MMTALSSEFCTDDWDNEIVCFVEENFQTSNVCWEKEKYLKWSHLNGVFWFSSDRTGFKKLTKQEFKKEIGMIGKQFTKDMLVAGKHVVELRDGFQFLVLDIEGKKCGSSVANSTHLGSFDGHSKDLTCTSDKCFDVVKVFTIAYPTNVKYVKDHLKLIWQREEKSQSQIELEKLQQQISELQEQAKRLEKSL